MFQKAPGHFPIRALNLVFAPPSGIQHPASYTSYRRARRLLVGRNGKTAFGLIGTSWTCGRWRSFEHCCAWYRVLRRYSTDVFIPALSSTSIFRKARTSLRNMDQVPRSSSTFSPRRSRRKNTRAESTERPPRLQANSQQFFGSSKFWISVPRYLPSDRRSHENVTMVRHASRSQRHFSVVPLA